MILRGMMAVFMNTADGSRRTRDLRKNTFILAQDCLVLRELSKDSR